MNYLIDLQIACSDELPVSEKTLLTWAQKPLEEHLEKAELTLRLVDKEEIMALNNTYRNQPKATNVLAFPANIPASIPMDYPLLGDVIICPSVLLNESIEQQKPLDFHWAHIVIHGVLHLLGFDHIKDDDAALMQAQEIRLLNSLGFESPYHEEDY